MWSSLSYGPRDSVLHILNLYGGGVCFSLLTGLAMSKLSLLRSDLSQRVVLNTHGYLVREIDSKRHTMRSRRTLPLQILSNVPTISRHTHYNYCCHYRKNEVSPRPYCASDQTLPRFEPLAFLAVFVVISFLTSKHNGFLILERGVHTRPALLCTS